MICEQPVSSSPGYLARVDVYDHVVHSVSVQVHDVHLEQVSLILPSSFTSPLPPHLTLPVLLHVVGEHGIEHCGASRQNILVAPGSQ